MKGVELVVSSGLDTARFGTYRRVEGGRLCQKNWQISGGTGVLRGTVSGVGVVAPAIRAVGRDR